MTLADAGLHRRAFHAVEHDGAAPLDASSSGFSITVPPDNVLFTERFLPQTQ